MINYQFLLIKVKINLKQELLDSILIMLVNILKKEETKNIIKKKLTTKKEKLTTKKEKLTTKKEKLIKKYKNYII